VLREISGDLRSLCRLGILSDVLYWCRCFGSLRSWRHIFLHWFCGRRCIFRGFWNRRFLLRRFWGLRLLHIGCLFLCGLLRSSGGDLLLDLFGCDLGLLLGSCRRLRFYLRHLSLLNFRCCRSGLRRLFLHFGLCLILNLRWGVSAHFCRGRRGFSAHLCRGLGLNFLLLSLGLLLDLFFHLRLGLFLLRRFRGFFGSLLRGWCDGWCGVLFRRRCSRRLLLGLRFDLLLGRRRDLLLGRRLGLLLGRRLDLLLGRRRDLLLGFRLDLLLGSFSPLGRNFDWSLLLSFWLLGRGRLRGFRFFFLNLLRGLLGLGWHWSSDTVVTTAEVLAHHCEGVGGALFDDHLQHALDKAEDSGILQILLGLLGGSCHLLCGRVVHFDSRRLLACHLHVHFAHHAALRVHLKLVLCFERLQHNITSSNPLHNVHFEDIVLGNSLWKTEALLEDGAQRGLTTNAASADREDGIFRQTRIGSEIDLHASFEEIETQHTR